MCGWPAGSLNYEINNSEPTNAARANGLRAFGGDLGDYCLGDQRGFMDSWIQGAPLRISTRIVEFQTALWGVYSRTPGFSPLSAWTLLGLNWNQGLGAATGASHIVIHCQGS